LITSPICDFSEGVDVNIDLTAFRCLQTLVWIGPTCNNLAALFVAIRSNLEHLQKLEVDFMHWQTLKEDLDDLRGSDIGDIEADEPDTRHSYFTRNIFRPANYTKTYFKDLRVLSLSQVPIQQILAEAINFDALTSLSLRNCPGWDGFLQHVLDLNLPMRLRTFEVQNTADYVDVDEDILRSFIVAFEGLRELFVGEPGPDDAVEFWEKATHHQATLKKFVYHQRRTDVGDEDDEDGGLGGFDLWFDVPDLGILGHDMRRMKEDPSMNPFARLDLEFVGLACQPRRLVRGNGSNDKPSG
jgi:hypothetical protein